MNFFCFLFSLFNFEYGKTYCNFHRGHTISFCTTRPLALARNCFHPTVDWFQFRWQHWYPRPFVEYRVNWVFCTVEWLAFRSLWRASFDQDSHEPWPFWVWRFWSKMMILCCAHHLSRVLKTIDSHNRLSIGICMSLESWKTSHRMFYSVDRRKRCKCQRLKKTRTNTRVKSHSIDIFQFIEIRKWEWNKTYSLRIVHSIDRLVSLAFRLGDILSLGISLERIEFLLHGSGTIDMDPNSTCRYSKNWGGERERGRNKNRMSFDWFDAANDRFNCESDWALMCTVRIVPSQLTW